MYAYAARTSLECTSKTGEAQAHFIQHAASACCVFFWRHHTHLPLWASPMATVGSVWTPENSPPAHCESVVSHDERHWCLPGRREGGREVPSLTDAHARRLSCGARLGWHGSCSRGERGVLAAVTSGTRGKAR